MITTTVDILSHLKNLPIFKGVYPKDLVPKNILNGCVVVNTDDSNNIGTHWVAIHYRTTDSMDQSNYFFDSYGFPPALYDIRVQHLGGSNTQMLQGPTTNVCGYYCIYFVIMKQKKVSMQDMLAPFSKTDFAYNDVLVVELVNEYLGHVTTSRTDLHMNYCNQKCVPRESCF